MDQPRPRAIQPVQILSGFGRVLDISRTDDSFKILHHTEPVVKIDVFVSHVWGSNPKMRYLGVLWYFNSVPSSLFAVLFSILASLIFRQLYNERQLYMLEVISKLSMQALTALYGTIVWVACFVLMQNVRHSIGIAAEACFLDRCCIDQVDRVEKEKGVGRIPWILSRSNRLLVLMSDRYFERLWCCYELAVFKSLDGEPSRRDFKSAVTFIPLQAVGLTILMMFFDLLSMLLFRSDIRLSAARGGESSFRLISIAFSLVTAVLVYYFSYVWYWNLHKQEERLRNFSLASTHCSDSKDQEWLLADIEKRFDGLHNFEKYVQTQLVLEIGTSRPKLQNLWLIALPSLLGVVAYIVILPQRLGLYCMAEFELSFVPKDDSFCSIIARDKELNYLVIGSHVIRFFCYYPVVIQLALLLCQFVEKFIRTGASASLIGKWTIHACGVSAMALLLYFENKGHASESVYIYHVATSSTLVGLFVLLYGLPFLKRKYAQHSTASAYRKQE